jgi:hypothetical protein
MFTFWSLSLEGSPTTGPELEDDDGSGGSDEGKGSSLELGSGFSLELDEGSGTELDMPNSSRGSIGVMIG